MSGAQSDARERFLRAIAERIAPERVDEIHLFPAIRQGGRETGVAVIAVRPDEPAVEENVVADEVIEVEAADDAPMVIDDAADDALASDDAAEVVESERDDIEGEPVEESLVEESAPAPAPRRCTVFRAHYRLTLKGAERGKWEVGVVEEADAPASTIDEVVRGVHERAAVGDDVPERLTGDAFRELIARAGEPWAAPR